MMLFFILSVLLLVLCLTANLFIQQAPKTRFVLTSAFAALSVVALGGLLFEKLSAGHAEFLHPWAFTL